MALLPHPTLFLNTTALSVGCTSLHTERTFSMTLRLLLQDIYFNGAIEQLPEADYYIKE